MRASRRLTLGGLVAVLVASLIVFALVLAESQRSAREDVEGRFRERAVASATLGASLFETAAQTAQLINARRYGGPEIPQAPLDRRARDGNNRFLVVVDGAGRILAGSDGAGPRIQWLISSGPPDVRRALRGADYALSGVLQGYGRTPLMLYTQAFDTALGRRGLVTGLEASAVGQFLAGSLRRLPRTRGGRQYVLDGEGQIIATGVTTRGRVGAIVREPGLLTALRGGRDEGTLPGDRAFVTRPVEGTPWRVVRIVPRERLFGSVEGINQWGPWVLFCGFALAGFSAVALVGGVLRQAARIEASNAALGERAGQLAAANAQLERVNAELARSNAELERFASVASHDLKEPLRKVQMFSERIEHHDGGVLSDRSRDYLARMGSASLRMQDLIDGLLVYSRVTMKPGPMREVDLGAIAREVVEDLHAAVAEAGARVVVGELPTVAADALQMRQLLQNLIANGLKFRREGVVPEIRVAGAVEGEVVVLTVADNGIGVDPASAERVFGIFERLHRRADYPGTGIGLALCRRIAERHGGSITLRSTPGKGSEFEVTLPRSAA